MSHLPGTLVSTVWLQHNLGIEDLVVVDIRGYVKARDIGNGQQTADYLPALDEYLQSHIPGSVFVDWTADITDPDDSVKAQIASPERFQLAMESRGIGDEVDVVVVDHTGGHFATRLWWALRYYGHNRVAVLDGGFKKWASEERPLTDTIPSPAPQTFTPVVQPAMRSTWEDVQAMINAPDATIVDARDPETFSGATHRGSRAGHIPGAVNLPAATFFNPDGTWKTDEELAELIKQAGIDSNKTTAAYCNGGVTATSVLFALDRLGIQNATNYDGSWNEWGERVDLPVETS